MLKKVFPVSFSNLPLPIRIIGIFFILTPVTSFMAKALIMEVPMTEFRIILKSFTIFNFGLNFIGFLIGLGLIGVKRWGYFLFLAFNTILILHSMYITFDFMAGDKVVREFYIYRYLKVANETEAYQRFAFNFAFVLASFSFILYFLNAEISKPYLTLLPRGFRKKWRTEIPIKGYILDTLGNKLELTTVDVSPSGCLASVSGPVKDEDDYTVVLDLEKEWKVNASMVRIEDKNVGLRFNYEKGSDAKKELKKFLESKLLPRYSIINPVTITSGNRTFTDSMVNISEGGFYVSTREKVQLKQEVQFSFKLFGLNFSGSGEVSWLNDRGNYEKPAGFGVSYTSISKSILYDLFIFLVRLSTNIEARER